MQINPINSRLTSEMMIKSGIKTTSQLIMFLREVLGVRIPNSRLCNNPTHLPPFRLLSDMFLAKVHNAVGLANRSGSKSFSAGILTFLRSIFPQSSTRLLGGSVDQSDKSYQAFADCWKISGLGPQQLNGEVQQKKTKLKNGVAVEILTASDKSVRGPHQENLILDEIDVMEPKIFEASLSQPQSKGDNKASTLILSTRHVAGGLMEQVIEDHKKMGLSLYVWCIWEVLESCRDYKCSTCPISGICPGKQMKNATGYYTIDDLVNKLKVLDEESFDSEWLCEKPSRKQFVYSKFNEDVHVIDCDFNDNLPLVLSMDFGGIDPNVVLVWQQIPKRGDVIVDEFYQPNCTTQETIELCKGTKWWKYAQGATAYCDPSGQEPIGQWRTAGVNARGQSSTIDDINLVKSKIAPMRGDPSLFISRKCKMTIWEMSHYKTDKDNHPIKKNDHACDSIRYYVRGTKITTTSDRPRVILGPRRDLLGRPLTSWPLWKDERG